MELVLTESEHPYVRAEETRRAFKRIALAVSSFSLKATLSLKLSLPIRYEANTQSIGVCFSPLKRETISLSKAMG